MTRLARNAGPGREKPTPAFRDCGPILQPRSSSRNEALAGGSDGRGSSAEGSRRAAGRSAQEGPGGTDLGGRLIGELREVRAEKLCQMQGGCVVGGRLGPGIPGI